MVSQAVDTLKSGLRVVTVPMEGAKSVTALALVGVGSRYESKEKAGISHFFEHMVFKGTKKWPEASDLAEAVDGIGADFNAFTGKEYTGFYVRSDANHLGLSLDVLSDMLYTARLRSSDLEREKGVIVEEINMYNDLPQRRVQDVFDRVMYGDVGLGRQIDGYKKTVKKFVRADFEKHLGRYYGLDNVCVVVAGEPGAVGKAKGMVEKCFAKGEGLGKFKGEKKNEHGNPGKVELTVECKQCDQAHFVLGFPSYPLVHPDRYALSLLNVILGGNMSSRLFTEVREKRGLAYYSRSDVDRYADVGSLSASEGVDVNRVDEAVKVTLEVFSDVAGNGKNRITGKELGRAKDYLTGSMTLALESSRSVAQYWAMRVVLGDEVIGPDEVLERVRAVTLEDVKRVAKDVIVPEKLVFALVGPFDDSGKFERLLKF